MSAASQVNPYRPLGVLLGGPFAPQRSTAPKPVACALLRCWERLAEATNQMHSTGSASVVTPAEVGHHG
jgi:hypothetical protein